MLYQQIINHEYLFSLNTNVKKNGLLIKNTCSKCYNKLKFLTVMDYGYRSELHHFLYSMKFIQNTEIYRLKFFLNNISIYLYFYL